MGFLYNESNLPETTAADEPITKNIHVWPSKLLVSGSRLWGATLSFPAATTSH